jgi:hypothetical protein
MLPIRQAVLQYIIYLHALAPRADPRELANLAHLVDFCGEGAVADQATFDDYMQYFSGVPALPGLDQLCQARLSTASHLLAWLQANRLLPTPE